jgi:hypothetical protein
MTRKKNKTKTLSFEMVINNRAYNVKATPYTIATGETRFRVSYNNSPVHIFGWDNGLERLAEVEDATDILVPVVEMAIARELENNFKELEVAA